MIRKAFIMSVHPGMETEYRRRHNPIWPELAAILKDHGVHSYSIYLDPQTRFLFAYAEIEDEEKWKSVAQTEICRKWWAHMKEVMPSNGDDSPLSRDLTEVFHLEETAGSGAGKT